MGWIKKKEVVGWATLDKNLFSMDIMLKVKHLWFSTGSRKGFYHGSLENIDSLKEHFLRENFGLDSVFFAISSFKLLALLGSLLSV